jgi:hypothetical protein
LSTHLRLGLPSGVFPSGNNILYSFLFSHIRAPCPAHLILLDLIILIILGEEYKLWQTKMYTMETTKIDPVLIYVSSLLSRTGIAQTVQPWTTGRTARVRFVFWAQHQEQLQHPSNLLSNGYWGFFPRR